MNLILLLKLASYAIFHGNIAIATHIAPQQLPINNKNQLYYLPYYSNKNISKKDPSIKYAVIVVHGILKNAGGAFNNIVQDMKQSNCPDNFLIIAPQFLTKADSKNFHLSTHILYWQFQNWDEGGIALNLQPTASINSFTVINELLKIISSKDVYPNLTKIYLLGFSAGGQFIQNYAFFNSEEKKLNAIGISVTYILLSPSSYLYFNRQRWRKKTQTFAIPSQKIRKNCLHFNSYHYGLEQVNLLLNFNFNLKKLVNQYQYKNIYYIIGGADDKHDIFLDTHCAANLEGKNRLQRAELYFKYLIHLYGNKILKNQFFFIIPKISHNQNEMLRTKALSNLLFKPNS